MNPAHYTVWLYRAKIVQEMGKDIVAELAWLEGVSKRSLKNYQIWYLIIIRFLSLVVFLLLIPLFRRHREKARNRPKKNLHAFPEFRLITGTTAKP